MRRLLFLFVLALPGALPQKNSGSDTAIDSSDLGYRIGSIEAKIEGQGKTLDEHKVALNELRAALKITADSLSALTIGAKETKASLATISAFALIILTAVVGNLVAWFFTTRGQ